MCAPFFYKKCATFLWFASEFVRKAYCGTFSKCAAIRRMCSIFTGKVLQSLNCGALQDGALSGIASKCGAHGGISVARGTPRCRGTFVAFFLTYTVCSLVRSSPQTPKMGLELHVQHIYMYSAKLIYKCFCWHLQTKSLN